MFFALPWSSRRCAIAYAAPDQMRGSHGERCPLVSLENAAHQIETLAFELAGEHPSDVIAKLILLAAELERVVAAMRQSDNGRAPRKN